MLQQLSCFWQMFGNPSLLISFFCGCRFTCAVSTHLLQVASFPLKCLCWRCWLDTQREGNRASSSHLSHNMPGHHSKSHTNTLRPLARTLPYKNTPMQVAVRSLVLSFWPCLSKHNLLAGVLHCAICFFCFFFSSMVSAIHLTSQWLSHLLSVVPYVQFQPERDIVTLNICIYECFNPCSFEFYYPVILLVRDLKLI